MSVLSSDNLDEKSDEEEEEENKVKSKPESPEEMVSTAAVSAPRPCPLATTKFPSHAASKDLAVVGEESSTASSTPAKSHHDSPDQKPKQPLYVNLNEIPDEEKPSTSQAVLNESKSNPELETMAHIEPPEPEFSNSVPQSPHHRPHILMHTESIDPVTRDMERRMSMKEPNGVSKRSHDGHQSPSGSGVVSHAATLARSYGSIAANFARGVIGKAKNIITPGNTPKPLTAPKEDEEGESSDEEAGMSVSDHCSTVGGASVYEGPPTICRPKNAKKGPYDFERLRLVQELNNEHTGAVWCIKFSVCGRLMATAGQDHIIRVWVLKNYLGHFTRMRDRYSQQTRGKDDPTMQDFDNFRVHDERRSDGSSVDDDASSIVSSHKSSIAGTEKSSTDKHGPQCTLLAPKPFCVYRGHTADVLDLSWSPRNYFLLSSGMDKTVKLWHLTRSECLCCFQHVDIVTSIAFMPKDDRYFISGSMDGKIRFWHIPEKKVALWNEVEQVFITALCFLKNGKFIACGTYHGRCFIYTTEQLKYHAVIDVRSSRGKNARGQHKITSLAVHGDKLLITSNDSRIRMYDLRDMEMICKFKGAQIEQSRIRASFSPDGRHIISGSEDNFVYIWRATDLPASIVRKDRNYMWERVRAHSSIVTAAVFAPKPQLFFALMDENQYFDSRAIQPSTSMTSRTAASTSYDSFPRMEGVGLGLLGQGPLPTANISATSDYGSYRPSNTSSVRLGASFASSSTSTKDRQVLGDVIISADLNGAIKIFVNPAQIKAGMLAKGISALVHDLVANTIRRSVRPLHCTATQCSKTVVESPGVVDAVATKEENVEVVGPPEEVLADSEEAAAQRQVVPYNHGTLQSLNLDKHPYYVEREWWKHGKRYTFWANWVMKNQVVRREVLAELGPDRQRLKALKFNTVLPQAIRDECGERLHNMPRYSRPGRVLAICQFTGKRRGKIKRFRLSRHLFRHLADHGQLSGVQRAMW
ncbi:CBR-SYM-4 protein [Aphelenchoides avenae]|nr:CBR-SYM-4 protein [Aphelenchus avenae]